MRAASRRKCATADHNPATNHARIVIQAARTIQRRHQSGAGHTKSITQYLLRNSLVAEVPILHGEANKMTYSLAISLLPFVFCVLGIVGGYYIFRS